MPRTGENIYKRKDGRWEARYIIGRDENGKSIYRSVYANSYNDVRKKKNELIRTHYTISDSMKQTLRTYFAQWIKYKGCLVKESTYNRYISAFRLYIRPFFGDIVISSITDADLNAFIENLTVSGFSPSNIRLSITVLKELLEYVRSKGKTINCSFGSLNIPPPKQDTAVLEKDEQRILTDFLLTDTDCYKLGLLICLYTGLRIGEICALRWRDVTEKSICIRATLQRLDKNDTGKGKTTISITKPKTVNSERVIPIPTFMQPLIRAFRDDDATFVLTGTSKPTEPRALRKKFDTTLKQCNLPHIKFHALRHTFATRCVECGVDIKALSDILGHSSVRITLDRYVHISLEQKQANINKLMLFYSPSIKTANFER